jgi:hypothetical protein
MAVQKLRLPDWLHEAQDKREPAAAEQEMLSVYAPEGRYAGRGMRKKRPLTMTVASGKIRNMYIYCKTIIPHGLLSRQPGADQSRRSKNYHKRRPCLL